MAAPSSESGEGRVAIVTGGSRPLGRATVRRLATLGYAVVISYLHDQRTAESTVTAVLDERGAAVAIRADVADELDVERLFGQTIETFGSVDAVVHAVRGRVTSGSLTEVTIDAFEEMCRTNVRGAFIVNRAAGRQVSDGGGIVNVFSSPGPSAVAAYGAYAATTAALDRLTRVLSVEVRERGVTVNGVALDVDEPRAPARVADVVTYLLSDTGHSITGHVINL
jgi:3-oxoacyl-[acyl-carrier protein] reductase